jgi:hypothetical protein
MTETSDFAKHWGLDCPLVEHVSFLEREAADKLTGDTPVTLTVRKLQSIASEAYGRGFRRGIQEHDRMKADWEQRGLLANNSARLVKPEPDPEIVAILCGTEKQSEVDRSNCRQTAKDRCNVPSSG